MGAAGWKHRYRKGLYDAHQMNARAELIGEANAELKELEAIWNPDGTITVNTAEVRPSRVPFVVAHELLVHEGLARVFNPSAKKELMDTIWKDFGETDLMHTIQARYHLHGLRTQEAGSVEAGELTEQQKREAAESVCAGADMEEGAEQSRAGKPGT